MQSTATSREQFAAVPKWSRKLGSSRHSETSWICGKARREGQKSKFVVGWSGVAREGGRERGREEWGGEGEVAYERGRRIGRYGKLLSAGSSVHENWAEDSLGLVTRISSGSHETRRCDVPVAATRYSNRVQEPRRGVWDIRG